MSQNVNFGLTSFRKYSEVRHEGGGDDDDEDNVRCLQRCHGSRV
jgi:hypothetical protein